MVVRSEKRCGKMRGSSTHGYGSKKKHRGSGSRGGKGHSGLFKHKKSWALAYEPGFFKKKGFKVPEKVKKKVNAINLIQIDGMKEKEIDLSKLGFNKVLSKGRLTRAVTVKAEAFSEKAKQKIEEAGGKAIIIGEAEKTTGDKK